MAAPGGRARRKSGRGARRFVFLALCGLVILSVGFVLGVVVGQKWTRSRPLQAGPEPARKPPASARRALSEAEGVQPPQIQEKLTFYETLTAPLGATPPPPKAEAPRVEAKPRPPLEAARPLEAGREAAAPPEPGYTVQVVAYRARPAADEMERKLREAGFDAYVATSSGDEGRATYRVRVGSFASRGEAQRMAERLRSEHGLSPYVTAR
ncbi:MAG: SPOR domain-containing protein [Candidatus Rokubacteria bacterium]|nr:SPOR domain-containing protein [Candidatus Rokubacteria bacterium]